jgi:hypothetical protein
MYFTKQVLFATHLLFVALIVFTPSQRADSTNMVWRCPSAQQSNVLIGGLIDPM